MTTEKLITTGIVQGKYIKNKIERRCILETPDLMDLNIGDIVNIEISKINVEEIKTK